MTNYAAILRDHVTLRCLWIDRILLQAYVPKLINRPGTRGSPHHSKSTEGGPQTRRNIVRPLAALVRQEARRQREAVRIDGLHLLLHSPVD
jgi:hypothetical protein